MDTCKICYFQLTACRDVVVDAAVVVVVFVVVAADGGILVDGHLQIFPSRAKFEIWIRFD